MVTDGKIEKNLSRIDSAEEEIRLRTEEYKILHEISKILHETGELKEGYDHGIVYL